MKTNEINLLALQSLEACYELACQWEEEPECYDPWQRNIDA